MIQTVNSKRILHRFNWIVIALKYRLSHYFMFFKKNNNINKKTIVGDFVPPTMALTYYASIITFPFMSKSVCCSPFPASIVVNITRSINHM